MNRRQNNILQNIMNGCHKTLQEYSDNFEVSKRTIRNDIKEINDIISLKYHPMVVINDEKKLCFEKKGEIDRLYIESLFNSNDYYTYRLSPDERKTILTIMLFESDGYKTIATLSEKLLVSRNTLMNDLDELKEWFQENSMELVSSTRKGFLVKSDEINIRRGMIKLLLLNRDLFLSFETDKNNIFHTLIMKEIDKNGYFGEIEALIRRTEDENNVSLTDFSYRELVYYSLIMVNRISKKKFLSFQSGTDWEMLAKSSKYNMALALMKDLSNKFGFNQNSDELAELIEVLRSKSYIKNNGKRIDMLEIQILINEFIYKISIALKINYYLDFYLYDLLVAHLRTSVHRVRGGHCVKNPLMNQLRERYPIVFNQVKLNINSLEKYIKNDFTDDEISFITMYIVSVIEKTKRKSARLRAAIVCNSGQGTAQLVSAMVQSSCEQVEIIKIVSSHNVKELDTDLLDIIISTVPMIYKNIPCIKVNPILTLEDLQNIQRQIMFIQDKMQKNIYQIPETQNQYEEYSESLFISKNKFADIISEDSIHLDITANSWQEAVRSAGEILHHKGFVKQEYIEAMIENINKNGPYVVIYPEVAIPHALESDGAIKVGASMVRLSNPVKFNHESNDPVRFVIALSVIDSGSIDRPLYNLTKMMATGTFVGELSTAKCEKEIIQIIKNYEAKT